MTLIYKINDLESKIPYKQWEALKKEFVEFAKEKKQLETSIATKDSELLQLKEKLRQLKTNRDEAIEILKLCNSQCSKEAISKLERGKE